MPDYFSVFSNLDKSQHLSQTKNLFINLPRKQLKTQLNYSLNEFIKEGEKLSGQNLVSPLER